MDCALGREGGPSAHRVNYRYDAVDGINRENGEEGVKIKPSLFFCFNLNRKFKKPGTKRLETLVLVD